MLIIKAVALRLTALGAILSWCLTFLIVVSGIFYELGLTRVANNTIYIFVQCLLFVSIPTAVMSLIIRCTSCGSTYFHRARGDEKLLSSKVNIVLGAIFSKNLKCPNCGSSVKNKQK